MYKPFSLDTIYPYIGVSIKDSFSKKWVIAGAGKESVYLKYWSNQYTTSDKSYEFTYPALMNKYFMSDGSPCGVKILYRNFDGHIISEKPPEMKPEIKKEFIAIENRMVQIKEDIFAMSSDEIKALDIKALTHYLTTIKDFLLFFGDDQ